MDLLVSTDWLAAEIGKDDLRVIDASYFALHPERDPRAEYEAAHIPGAIFIDLPSLKDATNPIPFMLPDAAQFAERMESLGIGSDDRIVLYDNTPYHTSARAWWMFRLFGARKVAILDGSLAKWQAEGRTVEQGPIPPRTRAAFAATFDASAVRNRDQILANLTSGTEQLLDARGAKRFTGADSDPRPNVAPGHIPGSRNLPSDQLFNADGTWKRGDALKATFAGAGIDLARPLVTTCGSGVTAAILLVGAALLGKDDVAIYDGSWSEWGTDPSLPKAVGTA